MGETVVFPMRRRVIDRNVVGFESPLVRDEDHQCRNDEFVLSVWQKTLGESGVVYWDDGHEQRDASDCFSAFLASAGEGGYDVRPTSNVVEHLGEADAVVVTAPTKPFSDDERREFAAFAADGGWIFLHDDPVSADSGTHLNELVADLDRDFRFPATKAKTETEAESRSDEQFDFDPSRTYRGTVTEVTDGDTVTVEFDAGTTESIRVLGIDTPETAKNSQHERPEEWEGIEEMSYLQKWGAKAKQFGTETLADAAVSVSFDANEPVRDPYDRVLGYLTYDSDDSLYNREAVERGYARVYGSGFARHDRFLQAELTARADGKNVWSESDPQNSTEIRDRPVSELFFPKAASVRLAEGEVPADRVPVFAEESAKQKSVGDGIEYGDIPLVAVDEVNRVAVVGSPLVDETYEKDEGFEVDTSGYENFVFLTNLTSFLSDRSGTVLIDGGHGQFNADYALSNEDAAYYQRYLEGQNITFEQVNNLTKEALSETRALVVTTPAEAFTEAEIDAVATFRESGGAVVLVGAGTAPSEGRANLNDLAAGLGTDLRLNTDQIADPEHNVNANSEIPTTTAFETSFPLFDAFSSGEDGGGDENPGQGNEDENGREGGDTLAVTEIHADAQGRDGKRLEDEYVVFQNTGTTDLDLSGWTVSDEAGKSYEFPDGFTLASGDTVTLHSGTGEADDANLYWGRTHGAVWNNAGDTITVTDESGTRRLNRSY